MGRYTTVQTYTDQDAKVAAISYSSATTSSVAGDAAGSSAPSAAPAEAPAATKSADEGGRFHTTRVDNVSGSTAGAGSGEFHMYRASRRREMERVARMEKQHEAATQQQLFEQARKRKAEEFEARANKRADKRRRRKERRKMREQADSDEEPAGEDTKGKDAKGEDAKDKNTKGEMVLETPGGVPAIANDGSFLEKMLALQQQQQQQQQQPQQAAEQESKKETGGAASKQRKAGR